MFAAEVYLLCATAFVLADAQFNNNNFYAEKPGSCPPPLFVDTCTRSCYVDGHCQGIAKCCPTSCGGTVCSRPVTMRNEARLEKPGSCPSVPTGRWVCSSTCSFDSDCRGTNKCCKNRCGAFACQKPSVEVIESIEIPYNPQPEISPNDVPNGNNNPFVVFTN
ncbi:waprin-Phi1-like [Venturia canescens]|uniref:waprin-Phi1-like n=1 Tax=Venturia canescens TaxID=32260 RepID=UPI001C9BCB6A|nr:waprin-Phi1-like [Venturia canescens]XP_043271572.1 waprin-Phi1-like [Venturia canescens]